MSPSEALALLASVDDPHVVESGRVLAAELDATRRDRDEAGAQVQAMTALGVSLHKAAVAGRDAERAAVVAWLRKAALFIADADELADLIAAGAHREDR